MSEVQKTYDHSIFKTVVSNREIDQPHVNKLVKSITKNNLLHLNPIIVNADMEIIDGQHRLEAATVLGVEIFYMMDAAVSKKDLSDLNSVKKNWGIMDYINFHTVEKAPGFDVLSKFIFEHSEIPPSTALIFLSPDGNRDLQALKDGKIMVPNVKFAEEVAEVLKSYRNVIDWAYSRNFVLTIYYILKSGKYDHSVMLRKLESNSRALVKCISINQYKEMIEEIYNRGAKNRVSFKYS